MASAAVTTLLDRLRSAEPALLRLARLVSLASRVEPALLRRMRLSLLPGTDVGLESDLWWSSIVQVRDPVAMVLRADVRDALREELRALEDGAELERAWQVLESTHRAAPPVMRLEEALTYHSLRGKLGDVEKHLAGALDALASDEAGGMARWAARTLPRLPREARESEVALAVARLASDKLGGIRVPGVLEADGQPGVWSAQMLQALPRVALSLRLSVHAAADGRLSATLQVSAATQPQQPPESASGARETAIAVPATTPLVLDVLVPTPDGWEERRVSLGAGESKSTALEAGPPIKVRSLLGTELVLLPRGHEHERKISLEDDRQASREYEPGPPLVAASELWKSAIEVELDDLVWGLVPASRASLEEARLLERVLQNAPRNGSQRRPIRAHLLERDRDLFRRWFETQVTPAGSAGPLRERRETHFVFWLPSRLSSGPKLALTELGHSLLHLHPLQQSAAHPELWALDAAGCGLQEGKAYRYWFEVEDSFPQASEGRSLVTDPLAASLAVTHEADEVPEQAQVDQPGALVAWQGGRLVPCRRDGAELGPVLPLTSRHPNRKLVIYCIPADSLRFSELNQLLEPSIPHLLELGVNALQCSVRDPHVASAPAAALGEASELVELIDGCHAHGIRFIADIDLSLSVLDFNAWTEGYDPISGERKRLVPARQLALAQFSEWVERFGVDGVLIAGLRNVESPEFAKEFREHAFGAYRRREPDAGDDGFLVAGADYAAPNVQRSGVDCLWNERFKASARQLIVGRALEPDQSFEAAVRELIAPGDAERGDGSQRINYLGSEWIAGFGNERLYEYLVNSGVRDVEQRIELAFACLLTAVGIPMIVAGDEFGENSEQAVDESRPHPRIEHVDFELRHADPRRKELFRRVAQLVRVRTTHEALATDETEFLHVDLEGKRVLVWRRGLPDNPVVVVANFSDFSAPDGYPGGSWSDALHDRAWREVTQDRHLGEAAIVQEPLGPWQAKVYVLAEPPWRRFNGRWVLVAGTGTYTTSENEHRASVALGRALAKAGFGLITGGYPGVDHITARAYEEAVRPERGRLLHVVPEGRRLDYAGGMRLTVEETGEYTGLLAHAGAVVLIGGIEGTLEIGRQAAALGLPVYPLAETGGSARRAFLEVESSFDPRMRRILQQANVGEAAARLVEALVHPDSEPPEPPASEGVA